MQCRHMTYIINYKIERDATMSDITKTTKTIKDQIKTKLWAKQQ